MASSHNNFFFISLLITVLAAEEFKVAHRYGRSRSYGKEFGCTRWVPFFSLTKLLCIIHAWKNRLLAFFSFLVWRSKMPESVYDFNCCPLNQVKGRLSASELELFLSICMEILQIHVISPPLAISVGELLYVILGPMHSVSSFVPFR